MFFVNDDDPAENKAVCDLVNSGLDPVFTQGDL